MQFYEIGYSDPVSVARNKLSDLENEIQRLQKKAASFARPAKRDDKTVYEIDPKYEKQAREIEDKIAANTLKVTRIKTHLEDIDEMFKTFPNGLRTWVDIIDQKQYLERKIRNPEQFVCYFDWSEKEKIAELEIERKQKQTELIAKLAIVDECINKIKPILFDQVHLTD